MNKRAGSALFLAMAALFLIANRAAYKGYFQDDELNNIAWTPNLPVAYYAQAILTPRFFENNFRPVSHFYFREMSLLHGLDFPKYLPILHLAHLLNVWLVWSIARRLGIAPLPASLGTLLFAFHMAAFDVYWKPMYVFDLLCATFSLLSIFCYLQRRYVLAFAALWLAYKSKELAVMLPFVLACYEFWFAEHRSWKRLLPFFAVSLLFGLQAQASNSAGGVYTFQFTPAAFWTSLRFYAAQIFLMKYAGLALIALPLLIRDRRLWFGGAMMFLFFLPLLFLPGRLFAAYCYLPLAGLALMAAAAASQTHLMPVVALFCVLWIPWNFLRLRKNRNVTLAADSDYRSYVSSMVNWAHTAKGVRLVVYDGLPDGFNPWGLSGALQFLYGEPGPALRPFTSEDSGAALQHKDIAVLQWNAADRRLNVISPQSSLSYLRTDRQTPVGQLGPGWYGQEHGIRWSSPHASATLARLDGAHDFELLVKVSPVQLQQTGPIAIAAALNGQPLGSRQIASPGLQTLRWPTPRSAEGEAVIEIAVSPEYRPPNGDTRRLGVPVVGFGFR